MPNALEVIVSDPELKIDALILPGHVSTIIGTKPMNSSQKNMASLA